MTSKGRPVFMRPITPWRLPASCVDVDRVEDIITAVLNASPAGWPASTTRSRPTRPPRSSSASNGLGSVVRRCQHRGDRDPASAAGARAGRGSASATRSRRSPPSQRAYAARRDDVRLRQRSRNSRSWPRHAPGAKRLLPSCSSRTTVPSGHCRASSAPRSRHAQDADDPRRPELGLDAVWPLLPCRQPADRRPRLLRDRDRQASACCSPTSSEGRHRPAHGQSAAAATPSGTATRVPGIDQLRRRPSWAP